MVHIPDGDPHGDECLHLPLASVRFPIEWTPGDDFDADDLGTWPELPGRLEFVGGKIRYMPPSGDVRQDVCPDLVTLLTLWARSRPGFVVGGNEAGMKLGEDVRAADAAVWRVADLGERSGGLRRAPPVLAAEVAGLDDSERDLRDKARWYLAHGVQVVWLVLPPSREVVVLTATGEARYGRGESVPAHAALPDLIPAVDDFFLQLDR